MLQWFTRKKADKSKPDSETADIHPKSKIPHKVPDPQKTEPKPAPTKPKDTGLSQKDINDLRQMEFSRLGIPYNSVLIAEAKGVKNINPHKLEEETETINSKLAVYGFNIKISCMEFFECRLIYLDYQKIRESHQRTKGVILPDHSLMSIVVLREAERIVRKKHQLLQNPTTGEEAKKFQKEVATIFESLWNKSIEYQLRQQAQRRLRREMSLPSSEPLLEADITAMMQKIKAERKSAIA